MGALEGLRTPVPVVPAAGEAVGFSKLLPGRFAPGLANDRRVGDDASFYPLPCCLTILISAATPAPYRYTGLGLVSLINGCEP